MTGEVEEWREIEGTVTQYQVSNLGRVRSMRAAGWKYHNTKPHPTGYRVIGLYRHGEKQKTHRIHRLVMEAFVGPCPDGLIVCHGNDIKVDNRLTNLRYDTPRANMADVPPERRSLRGRKHNLDKLQPDALERLVTDMLSGLATALVVSRHGVQVKMVYQIRQAGGWQQKTS